MSSGAMNPSWLVSSTHAAVPAPPGRYAVGVGMISSPAMISNRPE
jgi:hypothetical protein